MRATGSISGVVVGACVAALVACASSRSVATMPTAPPAPASSDASSAYAEIERLYGKITEDLAADGLLPPAGPPASVAMDAAPLSPSVTDRASDASCTPGTSDTCNDSCTLSDSICASAAQICKIAKELGEHDDFANDRCARGVDACKRSQQRCCGCR
jgi:hypothetical protein